MYEHSLVSFLLPQGFGDRTHIQTTRYSTKTLPVLICPDLILT